MNPIVDQVTGIVRTIAEVERLDPAEDFYTAGLESVRALEVLLELESAFDVVIPDESFILCRTVNDIVSMIDRLQAEKA